MSYHVSNLGALAGDPTDPDSPAYYADKDGYVPELGDDIDMFTARDGRPYDPDHVGASDLTWPEWVDAAELATEQAKVAR